MTLITLEPDMSIEPGHQWIVLPDTDEGHALRTLLFGNGGAVIKRGKYFMIAHDEHVDAQIVKLIDELAHVRFLAPNLIQLTMEEVQP